MQEITENAPPPLTRSDLDVWRSGGLQLPKLSHELEQLNARIRQQVAAMACESHPGRKALLRTSLELLRRERTELVRVVEGLQLVARQLDRHYLAFTLGVHPMGEAIVQTAYLLKLQPADIQDRKVFVETYLTYRELILMVEEELGARDEDFLTDYVLFTRNAHPMQNGVEALAKVRGMDLAGGLSSAGFEKFAMVATRRRAVELAEAGANQESFEAQLSRLRQEVEERFRQKVHELHAEGQVRLDAKELEHQEAEERLRQKERELHAERQVRLDAEERLAELERQVREADQERLNRRREQILDEVRRIRAREVRAIEAGLPFRFDPEYGFLMAEARRRLREDIAEGEWPEEFDLLFLKTVSRLIEPDDFEGRFFHPEARHAIEQLNAHMAGQVALSVASRARHFQKDWLRDHRVNQREERSRFANGQHPRQAEIQAFFLKRGFGDLPSEGAWAELWDENPWVFVSQENLDTRVRKD